MQLVNLIERRGESREESDGWPGETGQQAGRAGFHLPAPWRTRLRTRPRSLYLRQAQTGCLRGQLSGGGRLQPWLPLLARWSPLLRLHMKKRAIKKKNGNNNHTKCCIHPANPGHGSHTAGTAPSSAKNW